MELTSITPGPEALRALSHPVRLRMLGLLRMDGPSTASALATRLGLNSGATSYHLRQLAQHGFVVDAEERGNGRDRWWRAAHQSTRVPTDDAAPDAVTDRDTNDAFLQAVAIVRTEQLQQAVEERPLLPAEWRAASTFSDWGLVLTPSRARELMQAMSAVVAGWEEDDEDAEGAAPFVVALTTHPRPGAVSAPPSDLPSGLSSGSEADRGADGD
ncbi:helix-turn-helix transcriptional regulator [Nocardioides sp. HDW12B]|uniref:ArsR/SmtB family transcription factor n=1 Tax=Nocardioides sp. HDW12B TaxID=2714939 RepID=UPI00140E23F5|nr:helix-turn-helix domain-containing protein [Nocardioides sp. HDW12B]QIK65776.1 helix-turn-helix transcriptional regulator [Nocardioides sp. HDW12B]